MAVLHCEKKCSPSFLDKEDFRTDHTVLEEKDGCWLARCDSCGNECWHPIPNAKVPKAYLTKYPRIEACSGSWVTSKDHERETLKRKGYVPVE